MSSGPFFLSEYPISVRDNVTSRGWVGLFSSDIVYNPINRWVLYQSKNRIKGEKFRAPVIDI
jgi:hypothetical protein